MVAGIGAVVAELWWTVPAAVGAGGVAWLGLRGARSRRPRHLAADAARLDLQASRERAGASRHTVRVARAQLAQAQADRQAGRATPAEVTSARSALQSAQREAKVAGATVRADQARLSAARSQVPRASAPLESHPLAQLRATHDALTARWMAYETDPAKVIAFPTMSDGRDPFTAAHLADRADAGRLRPAETVTPTPAEFAAYRDAVARLAVSFDAAEREAWRRAREAGTAPATGGPAPITTSWSDVAQDVVARSSEALSHAASSFVAAFENRAGKRRASPGAEAGSDAGPGSGTGSETDPGSRQAKDAPTPRVWPVPARDRKQDGSR